MGIISNQCVERYAFGLNTNLGGLERYAKEDDRGETLVDERSKKAFELVDAPSALTGHRSEWNLGFVVIGNKDGVHKHGFGDVAALILPPAGDGVLVSRMQDRAVPYGKRRSKPGSVSTFSQFRMQAPSHARWQGRT